MVELLKEEVEAKTQVIAKSSAPELLTAVSHVKSLISSIRGSPDTCCTSVLSMLTIAVLEKLELIFGRH